MAVDNKQSWLTQIHIYNKKCSDLLTSKHTVFQKNDSAVEYLQYVPVYMATSENVPSYMCAQQKIRSACVFIQSDQNLHWAQFVQKWCKVSSLLTKKADQAAWMRKLICPRCRCSCQRVRFLTLGLNVGSERELFGHWTDAQVPGWGDIVVMGRRYFAYRPLFKTEAKTDLS